VRALYLDLTGQEVPRSAPRPGRKWIIEELDLVSSVKYRRDGILSAREWLRSLSGVAEGAWFARDDLRPFAAACLRFLSVAVRKVKKRLSRSAGPEPDRAQVARHFARTAGDWERTYQRDELPHRFIRERQALALRWIDSLPLPRGAEVLEVGCGAGHAAVALARRGYRVHALDAVPEMLELTARSARAGGARLVTSLGDVHSLDLPGRSFDVVMALGVLPWLQAEVRGLAEMARVLRAGGWLIVSADNGLPLHRLLDPRATPTLAPLRALVKRCLRVRAPIEDLPRARCHDARRLHQLMGAAGLETVRRSTIGFGRFSLMGRPLFSDERDRLLHRRLQSLADRGWPIFRSTGAHHLILARKPG
jgi:ubiquinone/menaquinone biosynthesis C-methylase UbiE